MRTAVTTTVTVCVQCGHRLDQGVARCASCGHVVDQAGLSAATARRRHVVVIEAEGTAPVLPGAVAPIGRRLVALLLDQVLGGLLVVLAVAGWLLAGLPTGTPLLVAVLGLSLLILVAQLVAEAVTGATAGAAIVGIRTVSARTGLPAGLVAVLVRDLVLAAGSLVLGVGAYVVAGSGAWDVSPARRGWHDRAAGTMVLLAAAVLPRGDRGSTSAVVGNGDAGRRRTSASTRLTEPRRAASSTRASAPAPLPAPVAAAGVGQTQDRPETPSVPDLVPDPPVAPGAGPAAIGQTTGVTPGVPDPLPDAPGSATGARDAAHGGAAPHGSSVVQETAVQAPVVADAVAPLPTGPGAGHRAARHGAGQPGPEAAAAGRLPDEVELTRFAVERPVELLAEPWLRLVADTGEMVDVVGDGAIGRDPSHTSGRGAYHQVVLADPERSMSRLHLLFGPEQGGALLWVSDPGSTNGTVLQDPTGATAVLAPGVRAVIGAGWVLRLGDRVVTVTMIV